MQRTQVPGGMSDPVGQRRAIQIDALAGVDLGLAVQRQMVGIFGDQNLGDRGLGRQAALDQPRRRRGLHDTVLACPAGVFGPAGDEHPELRRHDVQPLAPVLADPVQLALAAGAGLVVDVDDDLNPRQMRRQRSAVDPALVSPGLSRLGRRTIALGGTGLAAACSTSSRPSSIWSSGSVSARRPKRCRCSSLMIWRSRSFCTRSASSIAFSVSGSSGSASLGMIKSDHIRPELCDDLPARLIHFAAGSNHQPGCVGVAVSRASWTRRQSSPSSSADNCAADKRITPSSILGQRKMPSSSRLANRHRPVPSQKISLIRSARLARNT